MIPEPGQFYLGGLLDPDSRERTGAPLALPSNDLTTHGVILGMTGSGKTGLGVVLIEEALLSGIPALILDPKGDMGNLLLSFPELDPEAFEPWVDPAEARRQGIEPEALAARTSRIWSEGLAKWELGRENLRKLHAAAERTIYTPGSSAGVPLSLLGSLDAPDLDWSEHAESLRDEIEGFVSGLLQLAGVEANPISDPEHILLANIVEQAWSDGRKLDLAGLIGLVMNPPMRKLGVFVLDDFFPEKKRHDLAMRLNGLVASSSFASWIEGHPLDIASLLRSPEGRPRAAIVHLAHLSDTERQFVVTLLLTRLITWMRQQPGTSELRALVYMDEMFGFAPPTAEPPSKKPILTLFKQARAHGVGMVVATQNPVDLDYKAMSNAGTWMIGRLQTERDKLRVLEGLKSATGGTDLATLDRMIGGLGKREFLLRSSRSPDPELFTSRWAMSFLRGTLTREELRRLKPEMEATLTRREGAPTRSQPAAGTTAAPKPLEDESAVAPTVPSSVPVYHLDPAAPWGREVGCNPTSGRLEAALVARVSMIFDERVAELDTRQEWEAVFFPLEKHFDPASGIAVDYDERDLTKKAPPGARYALPAAPVTQASYFRDAQSDLEDHLYRERSLEIFKNPKLKLYSRVGESEAEFRDRCERAAEDWADAEAAKLRERHEAKIERVQDALATAERRVRELEVDVSSRKQQEWIAGAGRLVSMFLSGKANARSLSGFASRRSMTQRTTERLRTATERMADKEAEIAELEEELAEELERIGSEAEELAAAVEPFSVGLEKTDVSVTEMALVWVPRGR